METSHCGLTRIEISYYTNSTAAESWLFYPKFLEFAEANMDTTLECLNDLSGVCHNIPLARMLETF